MKKLKLRILVWYLRTFYKEDDALKFIASHVRKHKQGIAFWNQLIQKIR